MITRRHFLAGAASLPALSFATQAAPAPRVLVDWHSHFVSRAEVDYLTKRQTPPKIIGGQIDNVTTVSFAGGLSPYSPSDIEARIKQLDTNGIARQLLTHTVALGLDATVPNRGFAASIQSIQR